MDQDRSDLLRGVTPIGAEVVEQGGREVFRVLLKNGGPLAVIFDADGRVSLEDQNSMP